MAELAREEVAAQSQLLEDLARQLKVLLLPRDPLDERNIMLEVRRLVFSAACCHQHGKASHLTLLFCMLLLGMATSKG